MDEEFGCALLLLLVVAVVVTLLSVGFSLVGQPEVISSVIEERYWDEKLTKKSSYVLDEDGNRYIDEGNVDGTEGYYYYILDEDGAIERRYVDGNSTKFSETLEKGANPFLRTYYSIKVITDNNTDPPTVKEEWSVWPPMRRIFYFPEAEFYEGMPIEAN